MSSNQNNSTQDSKKGLGFGAKGAFDQSIYGDGKEQQQFLDYIPDANDKDDHDPFQTRRNAKLAGITGQKALIEEMKKSGPSEDPMKDFGHKKIIEREDQYHQRRMNRGMLSPDRADPFQQQQQVKSQGSGLLPAKRSYYDIMSEQSLENEKADVYRKVAMKEEEMKRNQGEQERLKRQKLNDETTTSGGVTIKSHVQNQQQQRPSDWDKHEAGPIKQQIKESSRISTKWDTPRRTPAAEGATPRRNRWDLTPSATPKMGSEQTTPSRFSQSKSAFGETPTPGRWSQPTPMRMISETPTPGTSRFGATPQGGGQGGTRWDQKPGQTPVGGQGGFMQTPLQGYHPMMTPVGGQTPLGGISQPYWQRDNINDRNRPLTDSELDQMLPSQGYEVIKPPESYIPIRTPSRKLVETPAQAYLQTPQGFMIPEATGKPYDVQQTPRGGERDAMPFIKPEDVNYFSSLLNEVDEEQLSNEEQRDRRIMMLLLKVKNGTPPMRKSALKTLTEKAREFGAGPLFNQILPLLMSPTLEDQERHLLVKVIDRILYKLDDLVRPYVHKILVVIEPLLIDEDYYARVEGREIISNLAKAAGLATMISTMRPDIDHNDEYVRNTTARAFAVIASALGIPALLPFLKAVCQSKKSWRARHTGIKIVQQIAILMGCAVLPHLKSLVDIIEHGLKDEEQKVRTITALAISALAEASNPYGIEAFESILIPLWDGISIYRGKALAAFLKAIGFIIPLMDADHAGEYTKFVTPVLIREFQNNDDEMKKIVLKCVKQCVGSDGVTVSYVRKEIIPEFFRNFWLRRNALDKKNYKQLIETTVEIAGKVGGAEIIKKIVDELKDDNETYRKIVIETMERIIAQYGVSDIDAKLEDRLMDGILFAFSEQASEDTQTVLNAFGTIVNCLGVRVKPYIPQICGTIQWRLNNRSARVRQQAADLIQRIALVMKTCGEEGYMGRLGVILYEYLGEEYPEVLGSILGGLKAIVNVIGMSKMTPPIKDLLPRLTPILKNRHEKVQENCIDLVGRIADRGAEFVSPREWMRICFDLLDLLKAHKKGIRRATVNTFGYIAKAIGPQDVLATLLNNLRVQERQNRVCTTVAIAIVAETCGPFTVLPALMNEYRVPEMNVQNGVLKSLSFMFEYIGEMGKDYIYAITPLLEDALIDRDLVHRQTAASAVKHLSLGVAYLGCEDALTHLANFLWPNVFEISPHVINAILDGIEGLRVALGPGKILYYTLHGMFHPARRVREVYWKIYNNSYLGAQDGLVSAYPNFKDDGINKYRRNELEMMI